MQVSYNKLWKMLIDKGLKKQDLVNGAGLSSATVAKMGKNGIVSERSLEKLCNYLDCRVTDIIEKQFD